jgi:hypothetical protein
MTATIFDLAAARARRSPASAPRSLASAPEPAPSPPKWKLSQRGNPYVVVNDAFHIVIFRRGGWAFRIEDLGTGQVSFSERRYETEDAARSDALLAVSQLRAKGPARKP